MWLLRCCQARTYDRNELNGSEDTTRRSTPEVAASRSAEPDPYDLLESGIHSTFAVDPRPKPKPKSTTLEGSVIHNPAVTAQGDNLDVLSFKTAKSSLSSIHQDHYHQNLVSKMDALQKIGLNQQDLMKVIVERIDALVTELREGKERQNGSTNDVKALDKPVEFFTDISGLQHLQKYPVSIHVILRLCEHVLHKWKFLARRLGLQEHEIQQIKEDNNGDIQEQSYQMLVKWKQSQRGGSYQELGGVVRMTFGEQLYSDYAKMVIEVEGRHNSVANSQ